MRNRTAIESNNCSRWCKRTKGCWSEMCDRAPQWQKTVINKVWIECGCPQSQHLE